MFSFEQDLQQSSFIPVEMDSTLESCFKPFTLNCGNLTSLDISTVPLPSIPHLYKMSFIEYPSKEEADYTRDLWPLKVYLQLSISIVQVCLSIGKYWRFMGQLVVTVSRIDRSTSPFDRIRMKVFGVVAMWNCADFSFAKKVSGTQIRSDTSAPTNSALMLGLGLNDSRSSRHTCRK